MLTDAELAEMRDAQELIMTDEVELSRDGATVFDEETQSYQATEGTVYYGGKGLVQSESSAGTTPRVGDQRVSVASLVAKVPWTVQGIEQGHTLRVVNSRDPDLIGKTYAVTTAARSGFITCRRILLEG